MDNTDDEEIALTMELLTFVRKASIPDVAFNALCLTLGALYEIQKGENVFSSEDWKHVESLFNEARLEFRKQLSLLKEGTN